MNRWLANRSLPCYAPADEGSGGGSASPAGQPTPGLESPADGENQAPGSQPGEAPAPKDGGDKGDEGDEPRRSNADAKPETLLERLTKTVEQPPKDPTSDPAKLGKAPEGGQEPKAAKPGDKPGDKPEGQKPEAGKPPIPEFHKHPDFIRMRTERDSFKNDAEDYRALKSYTDENGLSNEDITDAISLFAMLHNNPEQAHVELTALIGAVDKLLGNQVPDDLKAKVDSGEMTEESAKEVSRARATARRAETRTVRATKTAETAEAATQHTALVADVKANVATWETEKAKTDPDFANKRGAIGVNVRAILHARGKGYQSGEDAVKVIDQAYHMVNDTIARFTPKPQARRGNLPSGGSHVVHQPAAPAKNLREAIDRTVSYSR